MMSRIVLSLLFALLPATSSAQSLHTVSFETAAAVEANRAMYRFAPAGAFARLDGAFEPPRGYERVATADGSFGAWLRGLPIRLDRTHVLSFSGEELSSPSAAIVAIDVGSKNLQQCADSAIRLHAEYLWAQQRTSELAYHFTSGDEVRFEDWVAGERIIVDGASIRRVRGARRAADHVSLRSWLDLVFMYAGTRSLHRDSEPVAPREVRPGDFFVAPGSPGHAVVVLDVAMSRTGKRVALLGQGFMPAQDFHVIKGSPLRAIDDVWFVLPDHDDDELVTPSWKPFRGGDARRWFTTD